MMPILLTLLFAPAMTTTPAPATVKIEFTKVGPEPIVQGRTKGHGRAVVLIRGLALHPISEDKAVRAQLRPWQQSDSALVRKLANNSDVYALAYGQTASVEQIASSREVRDSIRSLKKAGYEQIVLVGHSAGGLIARHLVEDDSELGVTRVVQVCSPNAGSGWAALKTARAAQRPFLSSLTRTSRQKILEDRATKKIPNGVEFVCVVGSCHLRGDGVVFSRSQWSADLQQQGVPAYGIRTSHWDAMSSTRTIDLVSRLVIEPQPRWDERKVAEARKQLLGS
jgi:pimeloyl-ACP methyl ester carboxylesterase